MTLFPANSGIEPGTLSIQTQIVKVDVPPWQRRESSNTVHTPERAAVIRRIVEDSARRFDWLHRKHINQPVVTVERDSCAIETLAHVWPFPGRHQSRTSQFDFLTTCSYRQCHRP